LRVLLLLPLLWLAGCGNSGYAPVIDRYDSAGRPVTTASGRGVHVVARGDTLYSIAWRHGKDFRQLAAANNIAPPYTIYPGQQIRLDGTAPAAASRPATTDTPPPSTASSAPAAPRPAAPAAASRPPASAPTPVPTPVPRPASGVVAWQWPADGQLISRFVANSLSGKGIIIGGNEGDPVRAAAAGVVVYRGSGLTGYGNLLIIKHDERWLSAYAHNERMLVSEGATVAAGQRIATMGDSGTFRTQLHFEIRRDGTPVDPITLLPRR